MKRDLEEARKRLSVAKDKRFQSGLFGRLFNNSGSNLPQLQIESGDNSTGTASPGTTKKSFKQDFDKQSKSILPNWDGSSR